MNEITINALIVNDVMEARISLAERHCHDTKDLVKLASQFMFQAYELYRIACDNDPNLIRLLMIEGVNDIVDKENRPWTIR